MKIFFSIFLVLAIWCSPLIAANQEEELLKKACSVAALRGIELEIERFENWLAGYDENKFSDGALKPEQLQAHLKRLQLERERYKKEEVYPQGNLPQKLVIVASINQPCQLGMMLDLGEVISRSGPFFKVAGIRGNDFSVLQPSLSGNEKKYRMVIYLVFREWSPFKNVNPYYVYIDQYKELFSLITSQ